MVKPARGEQGRGITVGVRDDAGLERAVAAAVRRPAEVLGDGRHTVAELIRATSRRRERATDGESRIPLDDTTAEVVAAAGWAMDDVPPDGTRIRVRRTANLHTGGTIEDVTSRLHPEIVDASVRPPPRWASR